MLLMEQMLIFSILIVVGVYARRKNVINTGNIPALTQLVFNYAMPAIILTGVLGNEPRISGAELGKTFLIVLSTLACLIALSLILGRVLQFKKEERGAVTVMTTFTNISMMGIPMVYALYGKEAMIYITAFLLHYNLLFFSLGYYWMSGGSGSFFSFGTIKKILNPGIISCILALVIYLTGIQIPRLLAEPIRMLGGMTAPLSMLLIGSFLADMNWKQCLSNRKIWLYSLSKMIIIPLIILIIMKPFVSNPIFFGVLLAAVATPAGAGTPLLAQLLNPKAYDVSLEGATLTTLIAIVTMPTVQILTQHISF